MKNDIVTEKDIELLVNTFYEKVNGDELLSPVFNMEAGIDWDKHLPIMYKFWGTQLLGTANYQGQPFPPHMKLAITTLHFNRWQELFIETVHQLFEGTTSDLAIRKAQNIANVFQYKLGLIKD